MAARWLPIFGTFAAFVGFGCPEVPARIQVKGPRDAVESTRAVPHFPTFEKKNETIKLRASAFDARGRFMGPAQVRWESSDSTVASVSQQGLVTILSSGVAEVQARTIGETPLTSTVELRAVIVAGIRWVEPPGSDPDVLSLGETLRFAAEVVDDRERPIAAAKVQWDSSSWSITVTPTGEVEARALGTATLTATARDGSQVRRDIKVVDWKKSKRRRR